MNEDTELQAAIKVMGGFALVACFIALVAILIAIASLIVAIA
jgi:hypothetical protein